MKHLWLRREGSDRLLLFFSGWGMDGGIAEGLLRRSEASGFSDDVIAFHDYRTPDIAEVVSEACASYGRVRLLAWSFGVMAARSLRMAQPEEAVAINGTLFPIDGRRGIDPTVFRATLDGFGEDGRHRFNRRMCGTGEVLESFLQDVSGRPTGELREELCALGERFAEGDGEGSQTWAYTRAIIGLRDLVFLPLRQEAAWDALRVPILQLARMPHYPFVHLKTFQEVFECRG